MKRGRKEEKETCMCNHGKKWLRGPMIGKGSFGEVYKASLKKPRTKYSCFPPVMAVKSAEVSVSGSIQKEREVLCRFLGCSNVIQCLGEEITEDENGMMIYNLLLEYASGGTLADVIKTSTGSGLPESDVKMYTKSILRGILDIHKLGYVHCDLKPENILIFHNSCEVVVKIGDFGSAKKMSQKNKQRKLDPFSRGTAMYMAPETWAYSVEEPSCDIWALGCIVLEMFTGKPAWGKEPDHELGYGLELPEIPTGISKEAKEFLKGCFVRKAMFRLTAEMLLYHSFLDGVEADRKLEKLEEDAVTHHPISEVSTSEGDSEHGSSFFSDESISESGEDSWFSSCLNDEEFTSFGVSEDTVKERQRTYVLK